MKVMLLRHLVAAAALLVYGFAPCVHAAGELDPLNLSLSYNSFVMATAVQPDGKMIIAGRFSSVLGVPRSNIARINADGTLDTGFNLSANSYVFSMAVQADGKVLLGGLFTSPRPYLARVNTDGSLDSSFNPSTANGGVNCVAVQGDGRVLFGGYFTTPRPYFARVNTDGSLDVGFSPNANACVNGVAVQADGKVLFGGLFTTPRNRLARLNADGTLDTGFYAMADSDVSGMALQTDGKVLVGGAFTQIERPGDRNGFARLGNAAALQSLSVPDATRALWTRGGAGPEVGQVTFELSTDGGTSWTALGASTRIGTSANWNLTGLSLPASGSLRARGRTTGGNFNGASGLIEQVAAFSLSAGTPDIAVAQPAGNILTDGVSTKDFGMTTVDDGIVVAIFKITNTGTANLTGLAITLDGTHARDFGITQPNTTTLAPGESTFFSASFAPTVVGVRRAAIHIANNVSGSKSPTDIALTGTALTQGENWRLTWFGTTSNTGAASDTADPYGTGIQNVTTFGLLGTNQDPRTASIAQLPQAEVSGGNLLYSFTEPSGVSGVTYGAEWCSDLSLANWQPIPDTGSGTHHIFSIPLRGGSKLFLRLKVTER